MTLYIQHGYGKSTKITEVAATGRLGGVILSPGDEDKASLSSTVTVGRALGLTLLLDPQSYIYSATPPGAGRCHSDHGLDAGPLHWSADADAILDRISAVRHANTEININGPMIAPTCIQSGFSDIWTPLSLQFARTASAEWGADQTIASILVDEGGLANWQSIEDWLDVATTLDVRGFYIVINRPKREYPSPAWDPGKLSNLMRLIYNLSAFNGYEVIWGYSDVDGLLGLGAGANVMASGWHYGLRNFNIQKWQPSQQSGGKAPAPRIYLDSIWTSIRAEPEGDALLHLTERSSILPEWVTERFTGRPISGWSRSEAQVQHLAALAQQAATVSALPSVSERIELLAASLQLAGQRLSSAAQAGVSLSPIYRGRVEAYRRGIEAFVLAESL